MEAPLARVKLCYTKLTVLQPDSWRGGPTRLPVSSQQLSGCGVQPFDAAAAARTTWAHPVVERTPEARTRPHGVRYQQGEQVGGQAR
jgi:hypothetical protein